MERHVVVAARRSVAERAGWRARLPAAVGHALPSALTFLCALALSLLAVELEAQLLRRPEAGRWVALWESDAATENVSLLITAPGGRLISFDQGTGRVRAVSRATGRRLWETGRLGLGPNEYQNPTALAVDFTRSQLIIHDPVAGRLSTLDLDGRYLGQTVMPRHIVRVGQVGGRWLSWEPTARESFYCWLDSAWHCTAKLPAPVDTGRAGVLLGEPLMAADGHALVAVPRWRGELLIFTAAADPPLRARSITVAANPGIEIESRTIDGLPATGMRISRRSRPAASALSVSGDRIALMVRPADDSLPWIDYYGTRDGRYSQSRRLPIEVGPMAVSSDTLFVFDSATRGTVRAFVWQPPSR